MYSIIISNNIADKLCIKMFNVQMFQRAVEVELSLKSKRESEKKRELGNRHLMHVLALLNTVKIQAHQHVQTVVESSLVAILTNAIMNDND